MRTKLDDMNTPQLRDEYRVQRMRTGMHPAAFTREVELMLKDMGISPTPLNWVIAATETADAVIKDEALREEEERDEEYAALERCKDDALQAQADAWHDQYD